MNPPSSGNILSHIVSFGYLLREMGIPVSPGQIVELIEAIEHVGLLRREDLRATMRCMLVLRREDLPLFELAFEFFWKKALGVDLEREMMQMLLPQVKIPRRQLRLPRRQPVADDAETSEEQEREEIDIQLTFSRDEALRTKDFAQCTWEEVQACKELIRRMEWRIRRAAPAAAVRPAPVACSICAVPCAKAGGLAASQLNWRGAIFAPSRARWC